MTRFPRDLARHGLLTLACVALAAACGRADDPDPVQLTPVESLVERIPAGGSPAEVEVGLTRPMFEDDQVTLSERGEAILAFSEFVIVRLFRDTRLRAIGEFDPAQPHAEMFVQQGTLVANTLTPETAEGLVRIDVRTNAATITSSGTEFLVHVDAETQATWIIVVDNAVDVTAAGRTVRVEAGMQTWVELGSPPVDPVPATRDAVGDRFPSIAQLTNGAEDDDGWLNADDADDDDDEDDVDAVAPIIESFSVDPEVASPADRIDVSVRASDPGGRVASIDIRLDDSSVRRCDTDSCDAMIEGLAAGSHRVSIVVTDDSGNDAGDARTVVVDGEPPVIEAPAIEPAAPDSSQRVTIEAAATDPNGIARIEIRLDGQTVGRCDVDRCTADVGPLEAADHRVEIVALDRLGNQAVRATDLSVTRARPDLVVDSFDVLGPAVPSGDTWRVPVRLVLANVGRADAGPFSYSVRDDFSRPFVIDGRFDFSPSLDGLAAGQTASVSGVAVAFSSYPDGPSELVVDVDSCAGREFPPPDCDVVESDEANNTSAPRLVDFPPVARITRPRDSSDMVRQPDGSFDVLLDATGSFDADATALTYRWTVELNSDGVVTPISTSAFEVANFDRPPPCDSTSNYRYRLVVTDGTGNTDGAVADVSYLNIC